MKAFPSFFLLPIVLAVCPAAQEPAAPAAQYVGTPAALQPGWTHYHEGLKHLGAVDLPKALAAFSTATSQAPRNADYASAHALALLLVERFAEGRDAIERVGALGPPTRLARGIRAFAAGLTGDRKGALGYPRPQSDFEWFFFRLGESLTAENPRFRLALADARRQFPRIATDFAREQMRTKGDDTTLLARGLQRRASRDHAGAVADLAEFSGRHPDDMTARYHYGAALVDAGNFDRARRELSVVLTRQPALFDAYCQRAIAAARMGGLERARLDLATAKRLDPRNRTALASVEKAIAEAEAAAPKEPAPRLLEELFTASRRGHSLPQLAPVAGRLVRAAHVRRLRGEERYQSELRRLQWAVSAEPKSAAKLAALGQFLFDEVDVRGEYVDPGRNVVDYRPQTRPMQAAELAAARDSFQRALGANATHIPALMGMAQLKYRENLFGDAEVHVRRALALNQDDPAILDMMSRLMRIAYGQAMSRALTAATSYSWTVPIGNGWVERHTRHADPVAAARHASSATSLLRQGQEYARRTLKSLKHTPESYDYLGTTAVERKDFEAMRQAYERAVQLRPASIEYRYALANAYASLGQHAKYLEQATAGRNLEQTSIAGHLLGAWQAIGRSAWNDATKLLEQAARIDPGDSRIAAYHGAIAEGQNRRDEAAAFYRAALAIEEANGTFRASALGAGLPVCLFDEVARAASLRIRLARMIEEKDPAGALALYLKNLEAEPRLSSPETLALSRHVDGRIRAETEQLQRRNQPMIRPLVDALLPDPNPGAELKSGAPNAAGVLQTSRGLAGVALYKLGRRQEAVEQFRRLDDYRKYAGGTGVNRQTIVGIWTPRPVAKFAADCLREMGVKTDPRRRP